MRTKYFVLAVLLLVFAGCTKDSEQTELEKQNSDLMREIVAKDRFVEDVSSTINEIHNKLEDVWALEKNIMGQTASIEEGRNLSQVDLKKSILNRVLDIQTVLEENKKKVRRLQQTLKESNTKYAGLEKMVEDLITNLDARERAFAEMQTRVHNLEYEISQKVQVINEHETTIGSQAQQINEQTQQINTAYYIVGSSNELKGKGIITDEGGILWGLMGTTTVLSSTFEEGQFKHLDKTVITEIEVPGKIEEIIPQRDAASYVQVETSNETTVLRILNPDSFWKEERLVIVTDEAITIAQLEE